MCAGGSMGGAGGMSSQAYFQQFIHAICELVSCEKALLVLDCQERELRHPLLGLFPERFPGAWRFYGDRELLSLLDQERIRGLYDISIQTGYLAQLESIVVAPLACPAGIPGYILLSFSSPDSFTEGERGLLQAFLATTENKLEQAICALYASFIEEQYSTLVSQRADNSNAGLNAELVSMVSHELRVPLTAIKGYAGLLQVYSCDLAQEKQAMNPEQRRRYLDSIIEQTHNLEVLVGDLLDVSRIQSGKLQLHMTQVDISSSCLEAARLAQQRADALQPGMYSIHCDVPTSLPPIEADPHRLQQILSNLLENAIKYSPRGGTIELRASLTPGSFSQDDGTLAYPSTLMLSVRDSGIGIASHQMSRLFQPFSRLRHPATKDVPGVGLGLYITRQLVQAMRGSIQLTSQEGVGTTVNVFFPLAQVHNLFPSSFASLSTSR